MVIHHTASPTAANARGRSHTVIPASRPVASLIAVTDQASALASTAGSPICSRLHAARQPARQNRACWLRHKHLAALLTAAPISHHTRAPDLGSRADRRGCRSQMRAWAPGPACGGGYLSQGLLQGGEGGG